MKSMIDYALAYVKLGWRILPLIPGQKAPLGTLVSHGVKDATTDEAQIRDWWGKWPRANIGMACGNGIYAIDVDVDASGDVNGYDSLIILPELPSTVVQSTPRGGFHAFYQTDDPPANRTAFRPGIEIRGEGLYVVLAPSIHPNGGIYAWKKDHSPWDCDYAEFPDFMRPTRRSPWGGNGAEQPLPTPSAAPANADVLSRARLYLAQCDAAIQGGAGHSKLLWAAVAMVRGFMLPHGQAAALLEREYNPRCVPPWDLSLPAEAKDFRRKIDEAFKVTPDRPDGWLLDDDAYALADPSQVMTSEEVATLITNSSASMAAIKEGRTRPIQDVIDELTFKGVPLVYQPTLGDDDSVHLLPPLPEGALPGLTHLHGWLTEECGPSTNLLRPPGLVGEICDWINATAMRKQPLLALACTLAFCGVLFGRKVKDRLGTRTNIYTLGVADSSAGKNHAQNQIRELCNRAGCLDLIGGVNTTGDAAIESKLSASPSTLFLWDEIGFLLAHVNSGQSKHHSGLIPFLMQLYSSSGSVFLGREYADEEKQRKIIQPCCCLYGVSSPGRFMPGLTPEQIQDGWLARCLVFRANEMPKKERKDCSVPPSGELIEKVRKWYDRIITEEGQGNLTHLVSFDKAGEGSTSAPVQIEVSNTENSESVFIQFDGFCEKKGKEDELFRSLWLKGEENARKIALIVAAGVDFDRPKITTPIARYACTLVRFLLDDFCEETAPKISSGQLDSHKQKILEIIGKEGVRGCSIRTITRSARWSSKKQRESILSDLVEAGEACVKMAAKRVYYWTAENYLKYIAKETK